MQSRIRNTNMVIKLASKRQFVCEACVFNGDILCRYPFKPHTVDKKANVLTSAGITTLKNIKAVSKNEKDIPVCTCIDLNKGYPCIFFILFFVRHSAILSQNLSECNHIFKKNKNNPDEEIDEYMG